MPSTHADVPQLAIPFRLTATGREQLVEQGTLEELAQHAVVAGRIIPGTLDADPTFGTTDQTFREGGIDLDRLAAELAACDPRPGLELDQVLDAAAAAVNVRIREGS